MPTGISNGNSGHIRRLRRESKSSLTSPNDNVLFALKKLMGEPEYSEFFNAVYSKWRWKNYERYSQLLRDKLSEIKQEIAERDRGALNLVKMEVEDVQYAERKR